MAQVRSGIPNDFIARHRVALDITEYQNNMFLQRFGLATPNSGFVSYAEIKRWVISNTKGIVYHVEYNREGKHEACIWEFFFTNVTDAVAFKLMFV